MTQESGNASIPMTVAVMSVILVISKMAGLVESAEIGAQTDALISVHHLISIGYVARHTIYIGVWLVLVYFFYTLHCYNRLESVMITDMKDMERASLVAMIACIIKFLVSGIHVVTIFRPVLTWVLIYNVAELLVWLVMSYFLFTMWHRGHVVRKEAEGGEFDQEVKSYVVEDPD